VRWRITVSCVAALASACGPSLPEPESAGARVLAQRCSGCHRVYTPNTMTRPMWTLQLERMRGVLARAGVPWLSPEEERALESYLDQYAGRE